jgi:hypothetical protein
MNLNGLYGVKTTSFHAGILFGILFSSEDGSDMFLRSIGLLSTDYTMLYPRR